MPELPEVETVKKQLWSQISQKTIHKTTLNRPNLRFPFPKEIVSVTEGATFSDIQRHGKYLILECDNDYNIIVHLGMTGRFVIDHNKNFDDNFYFKHEIKPEHEHIIFEFTDGMRMSYYDPRRFGYFDLVKKENIANNKFLKKLGPDALTYEASFDAIYDKVKTIKSPIKTALLRQDIVAGIGNIYASEALWRSHIHPLTPTDRISKDDFKILLDHTVDILKISIENGGSTLKDYRGADGSRGSFQDRFSVYDRQDALCKNNDGGVIEKIMLAGRATYFCPTCQK